MFCRAHATRLRRDHQRFLDAGITVVAIGQGNPDEAAWFRRQFKLPFAVLADPERAAYAAYDLGQAKASDILNPSLIGAGLRALADGAISGKPVGDRRQLPGSFVIDRAGVILFAKPAATAWDLASIDELVGAVS